MIDVVLIHPNGVHGIYGQLGDTLVSREQPLWPRLIAGYLLDHGVDVKIIDAECEGLSPKRVADLVAGYAPKLACIVVSGHQPSASTQAMPGAREVASAILSLNAPHPFIPERPMVIMMGNHPSALPVQTILEEPVDYVIDGEGPLTIMGLLNGDPVDKIPGLVWCSTEALEAGRAKTLDDVVKQNPRAPLLDINKDLHGRAWHLLPAPSKYRSHNWQRFDDQSKRSPYAAICTSLGCAFTCSFCMINVFQHTNRYRMRDPQAVVDEMVMLNRDHGVETFKFVDELFVLNRRHTMAICDRLILLGLGAKINSWCYCRPDYKFENGELEMFRAAGFKWFALGIESGSAEVRDGADKSMSSEQIKAVVHKIEAAGIHIGANYIFGLPGETHHTMEATLALAQELNTAWANFYPTQAFPGSQLYDDAVAAGWKPPPWEAFSMHNEHTIPYVTGDLSPAVVLRARDQAFQAYFSSPRYLDSIAQRFGQGARVHVRAMTSYKLKRNLLEGGR
jgi:radical SAM superfamily enzyme YgiQ (UPF0313 family)